ncbi:MAG: hypothetical protein EZS28_020661 [Streblomastix strix]|uniref:Uncharacterized protein n=2 Tax=Streblomastix strix TaxID=222440 RepID=A0A5J4VMR8_9EUKA|nr:MAG: hypothetical protein EZS28_020661 [Streblomastix strix]
MKKAAKELTDQVLVDVIRFIKNKYGDAVGERLGSKWKARLNQGGSLEEKKSGIPVTNLPFLIGLQSQVAQPMNWQSAYTTLPPARIVNQEQMKMLPSLAMAPGQPPFPSFIQKQPYIQQIQQNIQPPVLAPPSSQFPLPLNQQPKQQLQQQYQLILPQFTLQQYQQLRPINIPMQFPQNYPQYPQKVAQPNQQMNNQQQIVQTLMDKDNQSDKDKDKEKDQQIEKVINNEQQQEQQTSIDNTQLNEDNNEEESESYESGNEEQDQDQEQEKEQDKGKQQSEILIKGRKYTAEEIQKILEKKKQLELSLKQQSEIINQQTSTNNKINTTVDQKEIKTNEQIRISIEEKGQSDQQQNPTDIQKQTPAIEQTNTINQINTTSSDVQIIKSTTQPNNRIIPPMNKPKISIAAQVLSDPNRLINKENSFASMIRQKGIGGRQVVNHQQPKQQQYQQSGIRGVIASPYRQTFPEELYQRRGGNTPMISAGKDKDYYNNNNNNEDEQDQDEQDNENNKQDKEQNIGRGRKRRRLNPDEDDSDLDDDELDDIDLNQQQSPKPSEEVIDTLSDVSSDSDIDGSGVVSDNLVLALYQTYSIKKNKYKFVLRDGIMHINGHDYVFSRCDCEFTFGKPPRAAGKKQKVKK